MTHDRLFRPANILAVDDKRANLLALDAVLGDRFSVIFADSGSEALELLEKRRDIDVVLMDVQMPGMDGFEAAARIQKLKHCEDIPIVFVTAEYREDPHVKRRYAVGGMDYFGKPFDPDVLRRKLAVYASLSQRAQLLRERERTLRECEELRGLGKRFSSMLGRASWGVLIADGDGVIRQCSRAASDILGPEPGEASYAEIAAWWEASGRALVREGGRLPSGEELEEACLDIRCRDGSMKTVRVAACALCRLDGGAAGAVVLVQDVTGPAKVARDLEGRVARLVGAELGNHA